MDPHCRKNVSDMSIALYPSSIMKLFFMFVEDVGRGMKECLIKCFVSFLYALKIHFAVCSGSTVLCFLLQCVRQEVMQPVYILWTERIII